MRTLALDQSFRVTGYSIFDGDKLISCGTWEIPATLPLESRLRQVLSNIDELFDRYQFDRVAFEDIQMQMGNVVTYKKLAYVQAMILYWCDKHAKKYSILTPSHWRSIIKDKYGVTFGRKRKEQKEAAMKFAMSMSNIKFTEDMADSFCIGLADYEDRKVLEAAF